SCRLIGPQWRRMVRNPTAAHSTACWNCHCPMRRHDWKFSKCTRAASRSRPFAAADLGRRVRVLWQGAEYRGRGRETVLQGKLTLAGNRFARFAPVNFLNPERKVEETSAGTALTWSSVTTGNLAGIDIWLDEARRGTLKLETNVVSGEVDLTTLADDTVVFDGGGLGRRISVYRLSEQD